MVITLTGNNSFQLRAQLDKLVSDFVAEHGDLALERLDGEEAELNQILGAVESLPFLAAKKMVIVQELSTNKEAAEAIEQLIERASDDTELILVETNPDKRSSYYKKLKKLTDFREFNELDENQLADWLAAEAKNKKAELSKSDARYLVQRCGTSQMKLSRELEKLILFNTRVTRQTIDMLVDESPSSTVFNLLDSVFAGNLERALKIYDDQRKLRVEPQAIHGMLVWQMHAVAVTAAAPGEKSAADIARDSGMSPFVVQKSQRIARQMGRRRINEFMQLLRDIDYRGKHEVIDYDEALKYALMTLVR